MKKELISPEDAEKRGFAIPKEYLIYTEEEFREPIKAGIAYKIFYKGSDSKLYPPIIANNNASDTPIGKWLRCSSAPIVGYTVKEHRPKVMSGGEGTRGRSLGELAFRPGWHLGEIPYATQFLKKDKIDGKYVWPEELVWTECLYTNDIDYQEEAMSYGKTKNNKFNYSYAGLPKIPKGGSYKYRTNPNPDTMPWIIAGGIKVIRILNFEEVEKLLIENNIEPPIVMPEKEYNKRKKR